MYNKSYRQAAGQAHHMECAVAGKNRPLDEDDLQFVEAVLEQDRAKDRTVREEERAALDAYQQVQLSLFAYEESKSCASPSGRTSFL